MDQLQPYIQANDNQDAYPVYAKLDYTMVSQEVREYMQSSLPNVKNIVVIGLEVRFYE